MDAALPDHVQAQLKAVRVQAGTGAIEVRMGNLWRRVYPPVSPEVVRAAWAYVLDGRAVAVDLRGLDRSELEWLLLSLGPQRVTRITQPERQRFYETMGLITSVNLHPVLLNTRIGQDFIASDDLIFDLLPIEHMRAAEREHRLGLDLRSLRHAYEQDCPELLRDPHLKEIQYDKSILSITEIKQRPSPPNVLHLESQIDFAIYQVPVEGSGVEPRKLTHSSKWFMDQRAALLSRVEALRTVSSFAETVAVLRATQRQRIPNNLDSLERVPLPVSKTPRLMCRGRFTERCSTQEFQQILSLSPDSPNVD